MRALDVGPACNNRCVICPRESSLLTDGESLLAAARSAGEPLLLHGGEPTLLPDLDALIAAASEGGEVALETNGRAFSISGRAASAQRAGLKRATVTLLGATPPSHDFLTRTPGSFGQTLTGSRGLRAAGVALTVRLIVTRSSLPELGAMASLALGLGAREIRFSWARADGADSESRAWTVPRYALGLPSVAAASVALRRAGWRVAVDGIPACLAPPSITLAPTGPACFAPVASDDRYAPRCEPCALRGACPGVPTGYLARFGDAELSPR